MKNSNKINKTILDAVGIRLLNHKNKQLVKTSYYAIFWPDGTLRWLFNVDGRGPGFLAFYPEGNLRAKVVAVFMRFVGFLGLMNFFSKKIEEVTIVNDGVLSKALKHYGCDNWALFGGTPGQDRKVVLAISKSSDIKFYLKVPISKESSKLILNEIESISHFTDLNFKSIVIPNASIIENALLLDNVKEFGAIAVNQLGEAHFKGLREIHERTLKNIKLEDYIKNKKLFNRCFKLKNINNINNSIDKETVNRICCNAIKNLHLINCKFANELVELSLAHRDFTPWNSFVRVNKLVLLDFELMEQDLSMGFDLFHYKTQTDLMLKGSIILSDYFRNCIVCFDQVFLENNISHNTKLIYIFLYNVQQMLDYLPKYAHQNIVHRQALVQIEWWDSLFSQDIF